MLLKLSLNKKGVYLVWKEDVINFKASLKLIKVNDNKLKSQGSYAFWKNGLQSKHSRKHLLPYCYIYLARIPHFSVA